ncbi:chaperonin-like RBCX protein 1, chloroplastic isoform X2 [Salvia splendens]|uniref:chaperonin-like RBCX protein 1, chloroplastic isoform X2 n=1 Tax=Salvia splendens TaxID=180675 RepID=UPI001C26FABA|nr:chaperonin-like RBCX protein 1, chloroplastic isoform X2 [Salvia splendens]
MASHTIPKPERWHAQNRKDGMPKIESSPKPAAQTGLFPFGHGGPQLLAPPPQLSNVIRWFGEASPEAKAAKHLHDFFTYVAVRIVIGQLESYNEEAYADMMKFMENHSVDDGDKFCADLMRESSNHKALALRILEVRSAYCKTDFEWDNLQRLSQKMVEDRNTKVMRDYLSETTMKSEN